MASSTRHLAQAASRFTTRRAFNTATVPRAAFRYRYSGHGQQHRAYSSGAPKSSSSSKLPQIIGAVLVGIGGGFYFLSSQKSTAATTSSFKPTKEDYQKVYNVIAERLDEKDDYDDGSYGPVLVRLAWHCSGTYDTATKTGGSNGATMRFAPEADHGANAGLKLARDFMEPMKGELLPKTHCLLPFVGEGGAGRPREALMIAGNRQQRNSPGFRTRTFGSSAGWPPSRR